MTNTEEEKFLLKEMFERNNEELKELAEKFEKSEQKSKELSDEMDVSSTKYKEDLENLNKKLKEGEDQLVDKQKVIDALITKMDLHVARAILTDNNDDTKIILPENDSNKLLENESNEPSQQRSFLETIIHQTSKLEKIKISCFWKKNFQTYFHILFSGIWVYERTTCYCGKWEERNSD